jgi:hypothetical protein
LTMSAVVETTSSLGGDGGAIGVGAGVGTGAVAAGKTGEGIAAGPSRVVGEAAGTVAELPAAVLVTGEVGPASVRPGEIVASLVLPLQETTTTATASTAALRIGVS